MQVSASIKSFVFFIFFLLNYFSFSQSIYFEKIIDLGGTETATSVVEFPDGSIYMIGTSDSGTFDLNDAALLKLDKFGNILWTKFYGDSLDNSGLYLNKTSDGNLVFTGQFDTPSNGTDAVLFKIDTSGNILWQKNYGGPQGESTKYVEETSDKGFILSGYKSDAGGSNDSYIIKTDSLGNLKWWNSVGANMNEYADMVVQTPEGNFLLTGDADSYGAGGYDVELIKFDSLGNPKWDFTYGDPLQNGCQGIYLTSKGKYLSYGETEPAYLVPFDFFMELVDTNGASIWKKTFGGNKADALFDLIEKPNGNFVCTGYSRSYNGGGPLQLVLFETDTLGNISWLTNHGGPGIAIGYQILQSVLGGYIAVGQSSGTTSDMIVLRSDTNGVTGINFSQKKSAAQIFPNPTSDKCSVIFQTKENGTLKLFDSSGREVDSFKIFGGKSVVEKKELPAGMYFFVASSDSGLPLGCDKIIFH